MNRVVVTRHMIGICAMQVCAEHDVTDEEILEVCNKENPSGTTSGWCRVIRHDENDLRHAIPVVCENDSNRRHFIVLC